MKKHPSKNTRSYRKGVTALVDGVARDSREHKETPKQKHSLLQEE
ncbi:MAG: hypothetical protein OXU36_02540 [Candidatus Poribacteria bacterium]|nr:hypothetical protein [Candidatus Poribacteria bacterium]